MRHLLIAVALLVLSGYGFAEADEQADAEPDARVNAIDEILSQPMEEDEYAESVRCLPTHSYRSAQVLDEEHVLFVGSGGRAWLNRLRHRCVGLRPKSTLRFNMRENRACELDTFEAIDNFFGRWDRTSGTCSLGKFMPVTPEQIEAIKAAVGDERR
jgi:hypothetical protein